MSRANARLALVAIIFAGALGAAGCHREGPAERAGEKIDNALDENDIGAGPAQKAGASLDKAGHEIKSSAENAKDKAER